MSPEGGGGGSWETDICGHLTPQPTVFVLGYFGRSNRCSPDVFLLHMHRVLWRVRTHMQRMKQTVDPHHHHLPSTAPDPPLAGDKKFDAKRSTPPLGGVFAQRRHSANYYGDYPGNNP